MRNEAIPELSFPGFLIISLDAEQSALQCISKLVLFTNTKFHDMHEICSSFRDPIHNLFQHYILRFPQICMI